MLPRIARTIARHQMFPPGSRAGVAVSGGADSVCLLHALLELRPDLAITVLHLNHGLRGQASDGDAAFVEALARRLGLPFEGRTVELPAGNLEQEGREARRAFYLDLLKAGRIDRVATGHTLSDQAETVLYRFVRGSGTAGLAGILPVTAEGIVRPLIEVARPQVEEWLRSRDIAWREDESNRDPAFIRNRIRHEFLPALAGSINPRLAESLARTASIARDEEEYWDAVIDPLAVRNLRLRPPAVLFQAETVACLPRAVARRLLRRAIVMVKGDLRSVDSAHIEAILDLTAPTLGSGRLQVPGVDVFRSFDWVRLAPPRGPGRAEYSMPITVPGRLRIPGTYAELAFTLTEPEARYTDKESALDWEEISGTLEVRNWQPGDRYRPAGHTCEKKLKTLFQEARVPLWDRNRWPVVTCGEEIVWAARFGPAAQFAATSRTRTVLRVREIESLTEI
ncbi:MAG TPA: tRNA lysidine(34) synthetase TilS [Bryobacteraceae bacterium]|nr:tRNA lysidine(34) synthetase TilS [Bryobacteraceae bacterium]